MAYIEKYVQGVYMAKTLGEWVKNRAHAKRTTVAAYIINLIEKDKKHVENRK